MVVTCLPFVTSISIDRAPAQTEVVLLYKPVTIVAYSIMFRIVVHGIHMRLPRDPREFTVEECRTENIRIKGETPFSAWRKRLKTEIIIFRFAVKRQVQPARKIVPYVHMSIASIDAADLDHQNHQGKSNKRSCNKIHVYCISLM